jgi:type VI protein secretion system component VasF
MRKWRRSDSDSQLEALLRSHRADASEEFVDRVSRAVAARPGVQRRASSRLAFAAAVTVFILGTFASFGGLSYAASGAVGALHAVKQVKSGHLSFSVHKSSAAAQYGQPKPKTHKQAPKTGTAGVQGTLGVRTGGTLPFTGLSLGATALLSLALIGVGLLLRRRERQN